MNTKKKILIVDDDPVNSSLLADLLSEHETVTVSNIHDMYALINNDFTPDLILLDVVLPDVNGFEVANIIRNEYAMKGIPIVFVSAKTEGSAVRKGFESGGIDYIKKPFESDELYARVESALNRIDREKKLIQEATTDPLTCLSNRRAFFSTTESKISFCQRKNINLAIAIVDIDHFKNINDRYSHICGDAVLQDFAALLKSETRDYDIIGRYGGEEFILSFIDIDRNEAAKVLHRIKENVKKTPFICEETAVSITFSAGITDIMEDPATSMTMDDFVKIADQRLYAAKKKGRDCICCID